MEERASGLILRTRPLTESSLIVHWLTSVHGRLGTVAKGARRSRSPYQGRLDLFHFADFSFVRNRRGDLHTLREVNVLDFHLALRTEMVALQQACYFAALIERLTETDTPLDGLLELMRHVLAEVQREPGRALTVFAFEAKLLATLGLAPNLERSTLSAGSSQVLLHCVAKEWRVLRNVRLSLAQNREIESFLGEFLAHQLGRPPAGRAEALHSR